MSVVSGFNEAITDAVIHEAITDVAQWLGDPSDPAAEAEVQRVAGQIRPYCIRAALSVVSESAEAEDFEEALFNSAVADGCEAIVDPIALAAFQLFTGHLRLCLS